MPRRPPSGLMARTKKGCTSYLCTLENHHGINLMAELGFLMWNIRLNGGKCVEALQEMVGQYHPDVLLLVESDLDDKAVEELTGHQLTSVMISPEKSIRLYVRKSLSAMETHSEEIAEDGQFRHIRERMVFFRLEVHGRRLLLVAVHFPSKWNHTLFKQFRIMRRWRRWIEEQETLAQTEDTIIFGDLNLNPFDYALGLPEGLHAHPSLRFHVNPPAKYYNPMWSTMGDFVYGTDLPKIPGTFFWKPDAEDDQQHHWNSIDGVLIKRSLEPNFVRSGLEIITSCSEHVFATNESFSTKYSDHLPVRFQMRFE